MPPNAGVAVFSQAFVVKPIDLRDLSGLFFFFFVMREKIPIHEKGWACRAALTRETRDILANTIILHHTQCVATPDHTIPHNTIPYDTTQYHTITYDTIPYQTTKHTLNKKTNDV